MGQRSFGRVRNAHKESPKTAREEGDDREERREKRRGQGRGKEKVVEGTEKTTVNAEEGHGPIPSHQSNCPSPESDPILSSASTVLGMHKARRGVYWGVLGRKHAVRKARIRHMLYVKI